MMKYLLPSKFGSSEPQTSKCILPSTSKVEGEASRKIFLFAFEVQKISHFLAQVIQGNLTYNRFNFSHKRCSNLLCHDASTVSTFAT